MMHWKEARQRKLDRGCPKGCACRECCLDEAAQVIGGPVPGYDLPLAPSGNGTGAGRARQSDLPSDRQFEFLANLFDQRDLGGPEAAQALAEATYAEGFGRKKASLLIEALQKLPKRGAAERALAFEIESKRVEAEFEPKSLYADEDGAIYLVERSKSSGMLYALRVLDDGGTEYAPGAIRRLDAQTKLSLEAAQAWGRRTRVCCQCRRELTNPESIELGIGPICRGKFA